MSSVAVILITIVTIVLPLRFFFLLCVIHDSLGQPTLFKRNLYCLTCAVGDGVRQNALRQSQLYLPVLMAILVMMPLKGLARTVTFAKAPLHRAPLPPLCSGSVVDARREGELPWY